MVDSSTFINYHRSHNDYARQHRRRMTYGEKIMRNMLRKDQLGYRFLRQKPIGPYIADFYCSQLHLCIEVDGPYHEETKTYDERRDTYFSKQSITTLRFSNTDTINNPDRVYQEITDWIH